MIKELQRKLTKQLRKFTPGPARSFILRLGRYYEKGLNDFGCLFPSDEGALLTLRKLGWNPGTCIDVGAFQGEWSIMFRKIFPESKILMIEAQESKRESLKKEVRKSPDRWRYEIALLGANDTDEVPFIEMGVGSSVFEETSPYPRKKVVKRLTALDTLLKRHPDFARAEMLKVDTQGYELEVLKGAPELLKSVQVLMLEVSLIQVNANSALFADVMKFMTAQDFKLFDFCSQWRRKDGVLWQTDLVFLHARSGINIDVRLTRENWR